MSLSEKQQARLKKLADSWETPSIWNAPGLCPSDLKLLLEHFPPLRELIQGLIQDAAAAPTASTPVPTCSDQLNNSVAPNATDTSAEQQEQIEELKNRINDIREELTQYQIDHKQLENDLHAAQQQLADSQETLKKEKSQANEAQQSYQSVLETIQQELQQEKAQASEARQSYQRKLETIQQELTACQQEPHVLTLLRQDEALSTRLGLFHLPEDTADALVQAAAVLAQQASLETLWALLNERCEEEKRAASTDEITLLSTALGWCNHNRKRQRFQLIHAAADEPYDYERHLRSKHTSTGERVAKQHLPGIASGSEKVLFKPLIYTH